MNNSWGAKDKWSKQGSMSENKWTDEEWAEWGTRKGGTAESSSTTPEDSIGVQNASGMAESVSGQAPEKEWWLKAQPRKGEWGDTTRGNSKWEKPQWSDNKKSWNKKPWETKSWETKSGETKSWEKKPWEKKGWDNKGWDNKGWDNKGWDKKGWDKKGTGKWGKQADKGGTAWTDAEWADWKKSKEVSLVETPTPSPDASSTETPVTADWTLEEWEQFHKEQDEKSQSGLVYEPTIGM